MDEVGITILEIFDRISDLLIYTKDTWFPNMTNQQFEMLLYKCVYGVFIFVLLGLLIQAIGFARLYTRTPKYTKLCVFPFFPIISHFAYLYFLASELFDDKVQYARRHDDSTSVKKFRSKKMLLILYPIIGWIIPPLGIFVSFGGAICMVVCMFKYMTKKHASVADYLLVILFPMFAPFIWCKYYRNYDKAQYSNEHKAEDVINNMVNNPVIKNILSNSALNDLPQEIKDDIDLPDYIKKSSKNESDSDSNYDFFDSQF